MTIFLQIIFFKIYSLGRKLFQKLKIMKEDSIFLRLLNSLK